MKNVCLLLSACALLTASCKRSVPQDNYVDNGCIERVFHRQTETYLTAPQIANADSLMDANHIDHTNFRYVDLYEQHLQQTAPPLNVDEKILSVDRYVNGLRIFNGGAAYYFYDGVFQYVNPYKEYNITLDTVPTLSLARLRQSFTAELRKKNSGAPQGSTDSCYKAEFGYLDLNSYNDSTSNVVKVWMVSTNAYGMPPVAIYKDDGTLIGFTPSYRD